jgi:hypothetical protein
MVECAYLGLGIYLSKLYGCVDALASLPVEIAGRNRIQRGNGDKIN